MSLLALPFRCVAAVLAFVAMLLAYGMFLCARTAEWMEGK